MTRFSLVALLVAATLGAAADPPKVYVPELPKGAVEYTPEKYTQSLSKVTDVARGQFSMPRIERKLIGGLPDPAWRQSGGMHGVKGVVSRKYKTLPTGKNVTYALAPVTVENGIIDPRTGKSYTQRETGLTRSYPDGTQFDDVLAYGGKVFEHRVRKKTAEKGWRSFVVFSDHAARPPGYSGLTTSCAHCHDRSGSGLGYAAGNVPGGDGTFSDKMDWSAARVPGLRLD